MKTILDDEKAHNTIVRKLKKDLRLAATTLGPAEVRYFVDAYYQAQKNRITAKNVVRQNTIYAPIESQEPTEFDGIGEELDIEDAEEETERKILKEPNELVSWIATEMQAVENTIKSAMDSYAQSDPVGQWSMSLVGIGPVIAAGLLAHIDILKAPTYGHIHSFAGLINKKWEKGQKRPWNAKLKTLLWKAGQSFMKQSNHKDCFYGHIYKKVKADEIAKNEAGKNAETSALILDTKKIGKDTEAYKAYIQGKLPPAHVDARARRFVVKLFVSHWHHVAFRYKHGIRPPVPYPIMYLGHVDYIPVPNYPWGIDEMTVGTIVKQSR